MLLYCFINVVRGFLILLWFLIYKLHRVCTSCLINISKIRLNFWHQNLHVWKKKLGWGSEEHLLISPNQTEIVCEWQKWEITDNLFLRGNMWENIITKLNFSTFFPSSWVLLHTLQGYLRQFVHYVLPAKCIFTFPWSYQHPFRAVTRTIIPVWGTCPAQVQIINITPTKTLFINNFVHK